MSPCRLVPLSLLLLLTPAFAADPWSLTTAEFRSEQVLLHGIDDHGVAVTALQSQNPRTIPLADVLTLERSALSHAQPARFILQLSTGDRLCGDPVSFKGDSLVWHEALLGDVTVSARTAVAIRRSKTPAPRAAANRTEDVVTLNNGDSVHGILADLTGTAASVQPAAGGEATSVPLDSVSTIDFAATATAVASTAPAAPAFRIGLTDDALLTARSLTADEFTTHATLFDSTLRDLPTSAIRSIEQLNGPVVWLSSLAPSENVQRPYVGAEHPARFDQSGTGNPIRFGDRTFAHGIGVHAYSKLTWPIDPAMQKFRTQFAIDGDLPYAEVTVRVLLDSAVAYEKSAVRSGQLSPVVNVDLAGKKTITLEVDYGRNLDVQGRLNWIEPALLRDPGSH